MKFHYAIIVRKDPLQPLSEKAAIAATVPRMTTNGTVPSARPERLTVASPLPLTVVRRGLHSREAKANSTAMSAWLDSNGRTFQWRAFQFASSTAHG
jgi:hypothetical protein